MNSTKFQTKVIVIKEYIGDNTYFTIYNKLTWDIISFTKNNNEAIKYAEKNNLKIINN